MLPLRRGQIGGGRGYVSQPHSAPRLALHRAGLGKGKGKGCCLLPPPQPINTFQTMKSS